MSKRKILTGLMGILLLLCSSCAASAGTRLPVVEDYDIQTMKKDKIHLKLGLVSGPYKELFVETIQPLFSQKGYTVEIVLYDTYRDPNLALAAGDIDLNIFQHFKYLNNFKFEHNLDLSAIAEIPTAPMGIYSGRHGSLENLKEGGSAAIPNDSTNLSRALSVLNAAGLISLHRSANITKLSLKDITKNPKNLQFVPMDAHRLAENLRFFDLTVINGNYAIGGGLNPSDALFRETLAEGYINVIAVRTDDLGEPFVIDLIDVLRSDEYQQAITDINGNYSSFQYPRNFQSK